MSSASPPRTGRSPRRTAAVPRDTEATAFTTILAELIRRIPGARAAALVDRDGEAIDYAGALSPFDVKIAGAHWQIVMGELGRLTHVSPTRQIVVRGAHKSFIVRALDDAYAVVVVLGLRAGFGPLTRAFTVFERALVAEAGLGAAPSGPVWTPVLVDQDARARPVALRTSAEGKVERLEVLGAVMGLGRGERGFRVRLEGGFETMVVREPGGTWYTEEPVEHAFRRS